MWYGKGDMKTEPSGAAPSSLEAILRAAGDLALDHLQDSAPEEKADGSLVTRADREVEAFLAEALPRAFPGTGVIGEEGTRVDGDDYWVVDPIDGTTAFTQGLGYWGPTVCRIRDGQLVAGGLYLPRLGDFWYAERGGGAWLNRTRLLLSDTAPVRRHDGLFGPSDLHRRCAPPWPGKVRALGSTAAHLALVAAGAGRAAVIPSWGLWDVACGVLLIQEAGGRVCDARGAEVEVTTCRVGLPILAGASTALRLLTVDGWAVRALE